MKTFLCIAALLSLLAGVANGEDLQTFRFPDGFKWCVATAAYQIEGNDTHSDWWAWEQIPGKILTGEKSGIADDHWNRVEQDTQLMKTMGIQEYRMSVEWPKIEPSQGVYDETVIAHYKNEIQTLKANGIEPMITIDHNTLPQWLSNLGGWQWAGIVPAFQKYSGVVFSRIAPDVKTFITLNEPEIYALLAYSQGIFPPGKSKMSLVVNPMIHMLQAHGAAYHLLHTLAKQQGKDDIQVGVAYHLRIFDPYNKMDPIENYAVKATYAAFNWSFPDALETGQFTASLPGEFQVDQKIEGIVHTQDFIGMNYYSRDIMKFNLNLKAPFSLLAHPGSQLTDTLQEIYPEGFYRILKMTHARYPNLHIKVTENGLADATDSRRPKFILDHLAAMYRAIQEGVPVDGYCHWSLYDNFEWQTGYAPKFGLYSVDFKTQERTIRPSGTLFAQIAKSNSVQIPALGLSPQRVGFLKKIENWLGFKKK